MQGGLQALVDRDRADEAPRCAERPTLGSGDWRKARKRDAARSTTSRRGGYAVTASPAAMPAIVGCRPDSSVAIQSTTRAST